MARKAIAIHSQSDHVPPTVYILSDSLGETGEVLAKAAASQFNSDRLTIRRVLFLNSAQQITASLTEAKKVGAIVIYTLVCPKLKSILETQARLLDLIAIDVMGPIIQALETVYKLPPQNQPGLIWKGDEAYFKKVAAVDFAVKLDDGKEPGGLPEAEIIIIGISRTYKTPLCMYLAHKGFKAANIPLVPEVAVPAELFAVPVKRIVGLTIQPSRLLAIRQERLKTMGVSDNVDYANYARILTELEYADAVMRKLGCPVLDVTNRAIEETAAKVLEIYAEE
jgi:[pyruvate, water dikinase]-phosphate phosphotransferase / [pyruvate, water dikinase] kinase